MNQMLVIHPFQYEGVWVFDDEKAGLAREPFVSGADGCGDRMVASLREGAQGPRSAFFRAILHRAS